MPFKQINVNEQIAEKRKTDSEFDSLWQGSRNEYKLLAELVKIRKEANLSQTELAEKIKSSMFVFEDIITLDDVAIQRILREVETKELALALKGSSDEVAEVIYRNQSKRAAASLKEDIQYLGPVRLTDVEKAQQGIVDVVRRLEAEGKITLGGGAEEQYV